MSCEQQLFPNEMLTWCFTQALSLLRGSFVMEKQPGRMVPFLWDPQERIVKQAVMAPNFPTDHTSDISLAGPEQAAILHDIKMYGRLSVALSTNVPVSVSGAELRINLKTERVVIQGVYF